MTEPGEQISSEYSVARDDLGWQKYHESFSENFGQADPYLGFTKAYKLEPKEGKPTFVVARPDFEPSLKTAVDQIVPALSFLREVVGDPGIEIIKISPTSPDNEVSYAKYETGVGIMFSQKILEDMLKQPVDARAAIVHELVHNYLDYQEKGETFKETVPFLFEICYSVLYGGKRVLALKSAEEAIKIFREGSPTISFLRQEIGKVK